MQKENLDISQTLIKCEYKLYNLRDPMTARDSFLNLIQLLKGQDTNGEMGH